MPVGTPACVMPLKERERDRPHRSERERDRERRPRYRSPTSLFEGEAGENEGSRHSDIRYEKQSPRLFHRTRPSDPTSRDRERRRAVTGGDSRVSAPNPSMPSAESNSRPSSSSFLESRSSLPYPSFSKAHSKEVVGSRENLGQQKVDILTPEPTDITIGDEENGKVKADGSSPTGQEAASKRHSTNRSPPSPPLTNLDQHSTRRNSTTSESKKPEEKRNTMKGQDEKKKHKPKTTVKESASSMRRKSDDGSKTSSRGPGPSTPGMKLFESLHYPHKSQTNTSPTKSKPSGRSDSVKQSSRRKTKSSSPDHSSETQVEIQVSSSAVDSDATSIAPNQPKVYQRPSIKTRTPPEPRRTPPPRGYSPWKQSPPSEAQSRGTGLPPPPPPPPYVPITIPKVDYLLHNGGLKYHVPKSFFGAGESANMPQNIFQPSIAATKLFEPFNKLLDDYRQVISKHGSLAVATGYRSVARRLLDRLEAVFARDISSESCQCAMCYTSEASEEGVSWGEVLELVSGRQDLPSWPPFNIASKPGTADLPGSDGLEPMQKMDVDIPEEFREHYVRQSRKTKQAVNKWLTCSNDQTDSPPDEIDDETLMFAMLTYLDGEQRETFSALLEIPNGPPEPKRETPKPRDRPQAIIQSGAAIQRLYRLAKPPRDPETAIYLLNNPEVHHVLATLAAISNDEWDILTSGRFDGFLRSGADDDLPQTYSAPPVRASRPGSARPISQMSHTRLRNVSQPIGGSSIPSRTSTPTHATVGAPIFVDEDTEIAALAEIERDIYLGMEALEDAFEILHVKAEAVRSALRERGAGLQVANLARRGGSGAVEVLSGTPAVGMSAYGLNNNGWESSTDDGIDDSISEILPSDSASNISSSRRRRPKRRNERRTPVVVEEAEEEDDGNVITSDHRTGKRH
ncbi:hypothetical protein PAAG_06121 [Paracoccidioides lutzii Pb01]|uniref:5-Methylcytosine G/T mismatch-specific DNA glycosylase n=1 Tax=Paracoccidioides lutzii (strain ATCC MYA-826 / Pb01) TaxID=502779 RepID=C1H611_PARBA|nr:hypothetical protein PAAG_06121 [Paracoccidioides lutzii Pb01]EEH35074.2 hypothetical protein PAAG_06121 [Paracoccidioides lutzii Pb01]